MDVGLLSSIYTMMFEDGPLEHINTFLIVNFSIRANFRLRLHCMLPKKITCEEWIIQHSNLQFFMLFRMEKLTLNILMNNLGRADRKRILNKQYTGGHYPLDMQTQILIFLWYMATPDSLLSIGSRFKVTCACVMYTINRVLYFMLKLKQQYIQFPKTEAELEQVAAGFIHYPGVVGALDGTHIFVKVENAQQDSYIDRYRRHSINLMAVCDSKKLFTYIFVGFPGAAHDARVFENSLLYKQIERDGPNSIFVDDSKYHLIGDSAFPLKTWLMTPYKRYQLTREQNFHNICLSQDRVVIEHAFGTLKGRWRRLQFINTYNISKTIEIATAACILHNVCILNTDLWQEEYFDEAPVNHIPQHHPPLRVAQMKRDNIARLTYLNR